MGKRFGSILATLSVALGVLIIALCSNATSAAAATYTSSDMITSAQIKNQHKGYKYSNTVGVDYEWDATGIPLQNGDTLVIELPEQLRSKSTAGETIYLYEDPDDPNSPVIGTAVVNKDNKITVTFTDVEGKTDLKGHLSIGTGIGINDKTPTGDNAVYFPIKDGQTQESNLTIIPDDDNISKKGTLGEDADGNPIVTWTILANRQELDLANMNVYETVTDPNMTYIPGSVNVYEASWTGNNGYHKDNLLSSDKYNLKESETGFALNIPNSENQLYAITLQTKITDPEKATDGKTIFKNAADITWGVPGVDGETPRESASGSVTSDTTGNNSGSGSGNYKASAVLTKLNEDDNTLLAGAVYALFRADTDEQVGKNYTTDENGQITVSDLSAGKYYFKEITPPTGFQPNESEIPFTITGKDTTAVHVTAKDEKTDNQLGSVSIQKLDLVTGNPLAGAVFTITNVDTGKTWEITTDENGLASKYDLPTGNYTIEETTAPEGYVLNPQKTSFEIKPDHLNINTISFENEKATGADENFLVHLRKYDRDLLPDKQIGVPGATYELYDATTKEMIGKYETDKNGLIAVDHLPSGSYHFIESNPPLGYALNDEPIEFTLSKDDTNKDLIYETSDPRKPEEPGTEKPGTEEPGTEEPGTEEPGTEEPGTEEPGTEKPGTEEPGTEKPGTEEPGTEKPGTEEPGTEKPGTEEPGTDVDGNGDGNNGGNTNEPGTDTDSNESNGSGDGDGLLTTPSTPGNSTGTGTSTLPGATEIYGTKETTQSSLPKTGEKSTVLVSVLGLCLLAGAAGLGYRKFHVQA